MQKINYKSFLQNYEKVDKNTSLAIFQKPEMGLGGWRYFLADFFWKQILEFLGGRLSWSQLPYSYAKLLWIITFNEVSLLIQVKKKSEELNENWGKIEKLRNKFWKSGPNY